jgi:hypothetical protein
MKYFVQKNSVVRNIWGRSETVLFIFAGASAEFALNKAVDWLYYTGRLPSDPLARLFSTVAYARKIVFSPEEEANKAIDMMRNIHMAVEQSRGYAIPDWAYRDVLFMLIHYSIASFELFEKKLSDDEKEEVYNVFYRVGLRMELKDLPPIYKEWLSVREQHLTEDLICSDYTTDLFRQYKKHLGAFRYAVLIEGQKLVVPNRVSELLHFNNFSWLKPAVPIYKILKFLKMDFLVKHLLLPAEYKEQINGFDVEMN